MRFVNLTPHAIVVRTSEGDMTFAPSGAVARVSTSVEAFGEVGGIPLTRTVFGAPVGVPDIEEGTIFIVSSLVGARVCRPDVVAPDTGATAIRENGQVVAVRGFQSFLGLET